jgi:ESCRT-II complex subunit VPS25
MDNSNKAYQTPDFWNFPPFFTIQPTLATRQKQLELWKDLILRYHSSQNIHIMVPGEFPLFQNNSINRKLSTVDIGIILDYMIGLGMYALMIEHRY